MKTNHLPIVAVSNCGDLIIVPTRQAARVIKSEDVPQWIKDPGNVFTLLLHSELHCAAIAAAASAGAEMKIISWNPFIAVFCINRHLNVGLVDASVVHGLSFAEPFAITVFTDGIFHERCATSQFVHGRN